MPEASLSLEDTVIFQGLSPAEMAALGRGIQQRSFQPGENLVDMGLPPAGLFIIKSGLVTAVVSDASGGEKELATLGKGECIGEIALVSGEPCSATVRAVTPTEAWVIEPAEFVEMIERYPGLWRNLGRILSQRLVRTSRHLAKQQYAGNTVTVLLTDYRDDEAAALGLAIAASLARQSGKQVLLVDGRTGGDSPLSGLYQAEFAPSLSAILRDRALLKRHDGHDKPDGGLSGAQLCTVRQPGEPDVTEEELLTVLEWFRPLYDFVLFLARPQVDDWSPLLLERARSLLAIVSDPEVDAVPAWLDALMRLPGSQDRLGVAMVVNNLSASPYLETIEERSGRAVTRLAFSSDIVREVARNGAFQQPEDRVFRQSVDRIARRIAGLEIGLALGAGAAKGFAHIGVIKVLEENEVPVDYVAGCSIGAIVGVLYAMGTPLRGIEGHLQGVDHKIRRWTLPLRSLWSDAGLKDVLIGAAPRERFRDLRVPTAVVATDISSGREIVLRKGRVARAVQASVSVPGMFPPTLVFGRHLVDGGLVNPVPSQTVRDLGADIVIAVDLMSPSARTHANSGSPAGAGDSPLAKIPNLVEMLWRSMEIMQEEVTLRSAATADITIEPKIGRIRWSDFSHRGREFIAAGEEAAREKLPELRRLLPFLPPAA